MFCCCSLPDEDAEKVNLEPDSVSFMETLTFREHGKDGLQNGFSSPAVEDNSDNPSGGEAVTKTKADNKEKSSAPSEKVCPVGLHKAALLYPSILLPDVIIII